MLLLPDPTTAVLDPFRQHKTLNLTFFVHDPLTGEPYSRDPRNIAQKAEEYLRGTGIADTAYFGPEAEFYIFDSVRFDTGPNAGYYYIDSDRGRLEHRPRGGRRRTSRYKPRYKGGYFPVAARRTTTPTCGRRWCATLIDAGIERRDAAPRGRHRRARPRSTCGSTRCCTMADKLMLYKYVDQERGPGARQDRDLHAQAALRRQRLAACTATRACGRTASRCSTTRSATRACPTWPLLHRRPAQARAVAAGLHQPDRELLPPPGARLRGAGQPRLLAAQPVGLRAASRSPAPTRRPSGSSSGCPDPSCNPYLAFSAMLMAGLDGIKNKIEPPEPVDKDLYELPPDEAAGDPAGARLAGRGARQRSRPTTSTCSTAACSPPT